jgi:hypothetical protein
MVGRDNLKYGKYTVGGRGDAAWDGTASGHEEARQGNHMVCADE